MACRFRGLCFLSWERLILSTVTVKQELDRNNQIQLAIRCLCSQVFNLYSEQWPKRKDLVLYKKCTDPHISLGVFDIFQTVLHLDYFHDKFVLRQLKWVTKATPLYVGTGRWKWGFKIRSQLYSKKHKILLFLK